MKKQPTIKEYLLENLARQSAENYLYTIESFLKVNPKAKRYNYQQMVNYLVEIKERYPNTQTRIRILSAIKKYYNYLVWTGQRLDHPCKTLTMKTSGNHSIQIQDLFSSEDLAKLMHRDNRYKNLDIRNKVILSLLINQGLTSDEIIRLEVDNIDLDECSVYIKASSKLNRRTLPLKANQIRILDEYINETRPQMLRGFRTRKLIITKLGKPITVDSINAMVEPLDSLFPDKKLNPRTIRMSVIANWLNERKMPLEDVQRLAGHKWPSTTEKYYRVDSNQQRELINKFFPL
ncbi:MAG: tyrosine-type recombinase/integrase [Arcicella sp.]|nr:tyrosine-type recombinase/integrase [Arcicella sp.]